MARLVATISVINPAVAAIGSTSGVSYVQPMALASYALPVAEVAYILMVADAELDSSGLYQIVIDSVVTTDGVHMQLARGLRDSFAPSDVASQAVSKDVSSAQDTAAMQDQLSRSVQRAVADAFGLNDGTGLYDGLDFASYKAISNVFFPNDLVSVRPSKDQADFQSFVDVFAQSASKSFADTQNMLDSFNWVMKYLRTYQDSSAILDTTSLALSRQLADSFGNLDSTKLQALKATLDAFALTDVQERSIGKDLSDSQVMAEFLKRQVSSTKTDSFGLTDNKQYSWIKSLSDAFSFNDAVVIGKGRSLAVSSVNNVVSPTDVKRYGLVKSLADLPIFNDAGELVLLSYCEAGYVQADYVGASRSF
tara:strand:+ start:2925 stop:4019 length:1095 start_codon:yes stop_codon:yes gene_type:complete